MAKKETDEKLKIEFKGIETKNSDVCLIISYISPKSVTLKLEYTDDLRISPYILFEFKIVDDKSNELHFCIKNYISSFREDFFISLSIVNGDPEWFKELEINVDKTTIKFLPYIVPLNFLSHWTEFDNRDQYIATALPNNYFPELSNTSMKLKGIVISEKKLKLFN
jgi:hypothetical protein